MIRSLEVTVVKVTSMSRNVSWEEEVFCVK